MLQFRQGFLILRESNVITDLTSDQKLEFTKLWLYPASGASGGLVVANFNNIYVGTRGEGEPMTCDLVTPTDPPLSIILGDGQFMRLSNVIVRGVSGDGFFFKFT